VEKYMQARCLFHIKRKDSLNDDHFLINRKPYLLSHEQFISAKIKPSIILRIFSIAILKFLWGHLGLSSITQPLACLSMWTTFQKIDADQEKACYNIQNVFLCAL
jgi:hypothetical protein